jgi:flagellar basal-body rod protein FlgF
MAEISPAVKSNVDVLTRQFEQIANNLANVNTTGFKRQRGDFFSALRSQLTASDPIPSAQLSMKQTVDFSQGNLIQTNRSLDVALSGKGFFVIETPDGPRYTRDGSFQVNTTGQLVDSEGRMVAGESGPIVVPAGTDLSRVYVGTDGQISAGSIRIGKFRVVDFTDQQNQLKPAGAGCFQATAGATPVAAKNVVIKQGFQESSNVQMVQELVDMISVSRLYDANLRTLAANREASKSILDVAMG